MKYLIIFLMFVGSVYAVDICDSKGLGYTVSLWNYTGTYIESYTSNGVVNVTGTARKINWTSDTYIDSVVYKSGSRTYTTDGGYIGKIPKTTLSNDIVFVAFCSGNVVPEFGLIAMFVALIGALGVFMYVRR
jgi:hypothetical protein